MVQDIDSEHLGIPDTAYQCVVKMSSAEFKRICQELTVMGDVVKISTTKDGIKFTASGDLGSGSITCNQHLAVDAKDTDEVLIKMEEEMSLTFALRYLNSFAKATPLSSVVCLKMVSLRTDRSIDRSSQFSASKLCSGSEQNVIPCFCVMCMWVRV